MRAPVLSRGPDASASNHRERRCAAWLAIPVVLLSANLCTAAPASIFHVPMYVVGTTSTAVTAFGVGDLNGDGRSDVVYPGGWGIIPAFGNGDGSFAYPDRGPYVCCPFGSPDVYAFGDLDGDGRVDAITVSNAVSNSVSLYFSAGNGTFTRITHPFSSGHSGATIGSLAIADFDGDSHLDIAYADSASHSVQILMNAGDGTFTHILSFPVARPVGLVCADVNGDGPLDLVTLSATQRNLVVLMGYGDGDFSVQPTTVTFPEMPIELAADAPAGPGLPDLAVLASSSAWLVPAAPGGGLGTPVPVSVPPKFRSAHLLDVDGDARSDLIGTTTDAQGLMRVALLLGDGLGGFGPALTSGLGVGPGPVAVTDVDGDGRPDVLSASPLQISELLNLDGATFGEDVDLPLGFASDEFQAADLDGDGWTDLVMDPGTSPGLVILPGTPSGSFGAPEALPWTDDWTLVAITDVNRDLLPDIVVTRYTSGGSVIGIARNYGHLSFANPVTTNIGKSAVFLGAGDVDGDGVPDVVAALPPSYSTTQILTYRGSGTGTLLSPVTTTRSERITGYQLGDANGDGRADLLLNLADTRELVVALGRPDGGFEGSVASAMPSSSWMMSVTQFDHDGRPDLLVVSRDSSSPYIATLTPLLGNGTGAFFGDTLYAIDGGSYFHTVYLAGRDPATFDVGDIDGDGNADVVVAYKAANAVTAYLGDGMDRLSRRSTTTVDLEYQFKVTGPPSRVRLLDLDHDGALDAVVAHGSTGTLSILRGTGCRTPVFAHLRTDLTPPGLAIRWAPKSALTYTADVYRADNTISWQRMGPATIEPSGVASFHDPRVISGRTYRYRLLVQTASCSGYAGEVVLRAPSVPRIDLAASGSPGDLAAADVDRDGHMDVIALAGRSFSVFLSGAAADLSTRRDYPLPRYSWDVAVGDFNRDGIPDIATANLVNYPNADSSSFGVLLGQADGSFGDPTYITTGGSPITIVTADFNRDGTSDVAVPGASGTVAVYLGLGDGTFDRRRVLFTNGDARVLGVGDYDEDGSPDLAIVSCVNPGTGTCSSHLAIALGNGDGTFTITTDVPAPSNTSDVQFGVLTGDIDGDGHLDAAIGDLGGYPLNYQLVVWRGDGTGNLSGQILVPSALRMRDPTVMDYNHDAFPDLVGLQSATADSNRIVIFPGQGGLAFGSPIELEVTGTTHFRLADFDGNGWMDIVAVSPVGNVVSLFLRLGDLPTPTLAFLRAFEVDVSSVALHWWLPDGSETDAHVIRTAVAGGAGQVARDLGRVTREGPDRASFMDRAVLAGAVYEYRLQSHTTGEWLTAATRVTVPAATLRFLGTRPSPATLGSLRFAIELESRDPAHLELIDIAGRRVADLVVRDPTSGTRVLEAPGAVRAPGIYWARLHQGRREVTGRVVVLR